MTKKINELKEQKHQCQNHQNEALKYCKDCELWLCDECISIHDVFNKSHILSIKGVPLKLKCKLHDQFTQFYCLKCNEEIFASCSNDKSIMTWNFTNKKRILRFNAHDDCVLSLIKLKNGNLCSGGADLLIKIWNWKTGECLFKLEGYNNWIRCICQLDDKTLLIGSENIITIWENKQVKAYLTDHEHDVRDICVINENYFASGSFDNTIKIWETKEFNCIQKVQTI